RRPWTADGAPCGRRGKSPLHTKAARRKPGSREGRQGRRHDTAAAEDEARAHEGADVGRGGAGARRWAPGGETATPRWSKSKAAPCGPGRTLSPMPSEQKGAYYGHLAPYVPSHL